MNLFERTIKLKIGNTLINGLNIAFEIEKDLSPAPNNCHIEIFNLSKENRETLTRQKRIRALLKAGYRDSLGILFKGDLLSCKHIKEGPTWKTSLAIGDGLNLIQTARLEKSYAKGTPIKTIIKDLAEKLGLGPGNALHQLEKLNDNLDRGFMVSGNAMEELSNILKSQGYSVSIQDGAIQILKNGQALSKVAISLDSNSGLIGTPETGLDGAMTVKTVLMPELRPGGNIFVKSQVFNGYALIERVRFEGANFGKTWGAEIAARRLVNYQAL